MITRHHPGQETTFVWCITPNAGFDNVCGTPLIHGPFRHLILGPGHVWVFLDMFCFSRKSVLVEKLWFSLGTPDVALPNSCGCSSCESLLLNISGQWSIVRSALNHGVHSECETQRWEIWGGWAWVWITQHPQACAEHKPVLCRAGAYFHWGFHYPVKLLGFRYLNAPWLSLSGLPVAFADAVELVPALCPPAAFFVRSSQGRAQKTPLISVWLHSHLSYICFSHATKFYYAVDALWQGR